MYMKEDGIYLVQQVSYGRENPPCHPPQRALTHPHAPVQIQNIQTTTVNMKDTCELFEDRSGGTSEREDV